MGRQGVELWLLDVASARARRLGDFHLNAAAGPGFAWLGQQLLVKLVPARQGPAPRAPAAPDGPNIQQSEGGALSQTRTYPDLLKTAYDADLLDYQLQSQLALVGMDGKLSLIGQPERYLGVSGAPNRQYLLTTRLQRPIPRWCRCRAFPSASTCWIGRDASCAPWPSGRCWNACLPAMTRWRPVREVAWRADAPASLFWVEALDGGDPGRAAAERDALFLQAAPFQQAPRQWQRLASRFVDIRWGRGDLALVREHWWKTGN